MALLRRDTHSGGLIGLHLRRRRSFLWSFWFVFINAPSPLTPALLLLPYSHRQNPLIQAVLWPVLLFQTWGTCLHSRPMKLPSQCYQKGRGKGVGRRLEASSISNGYHTSLSRLKTGGGSYCCFFLNKNKQNNCESAPLRSHCTFPFKALER